MVEIQNYASQLKSMDAAIDDEMEIARVLSSLADDKYRQFCEAWRSVDQAKQTPILLLSRLKTWELEKGEANKFTEESSKAYSAKRFERKQPKSKEELADLKKRTKCHLCKEKGHWKSECPEKRRKDKDDDKVGSVYVVGSSHNLWINDSGANRHNCGRLDWYFEYEKYQIPKPVQIADNSQMLVEGVGKVKVKAFVNKQWKEIEIHNVEFVPGSFF